MSAVIKLGSVSAARIVAPYVPHPAAPAADAAGRDSYGEELDRLHALLAERDAALDKVQAEVAKARTEGEAAGRIAAESAAEGIRKQALALLREGIEQAQRSLAGGQEQMEMLALLIARTALEKLFGDDFDRKKAVSALVTHQLQAIERHMLLKIEVSRLDFPDAAELAELAAEIAIGEEFVTANADLPAGACRMQLRVGTLEVGVDQQWGAVRGILDQLVAAVEAQL